MNELGINLIMDYRIEEMSREDNILESNEFKIYLMNIALAKHKRLEDITEDEFDWAAETFLKINETN